ncbi:phage tail assembly chaperone [Paenibacillus sp. FSL R5-0908]|uniref:phage tail assembly chaperone n=1 Tax=Paenibacillus sp. FSL R5-0908 TaxID=2921664 RepID=UPI0030F6C753
MTKQSEKTSFLNLADILGRDTAELSKLETGEFPVAKLGGSIPWTAITQPEYKDAKKGCLHIKKGKRGQAQDMEFDDDKMKVRLIITAVDKDKRSDFSFANKQLLDKLGVISAEQALELLVNPGEIHNWAIEIQDASGFSSESQDEVADDIKN